MNRQLRKQHFITWIILSVVIALLLLLTISGRH